MRVTLDLPEETTSLLVQINYKSPVNPGQIITTNYLRAPDPGETWYVLPTGSFAFRTEAHTLPDEEVIPFE